MTKSGSKCWSNSQLTNKQTDIPWCHSVTRPIPGWDGGCTIKEVRLFCVCVCLLNCVVYIIICRIIFFLIVAPPFSHFDSTLNVSHSQSNTGCFNEPARPRLMPTGYNYWTTWALSGTPRPSNGKPCTKNYDNLPPKMGIAKYPRATRPIANWPTGCATNAWSTVTGNNKSDRA